MAKILIIDCPEDILMNHKCDITKVNNTIIVYVACKYYGEVVASVVLP
jgi:hypothetical protein